MMRKQRIHLIERQVLVQDTGIVTMDDYLDITYPISNRVVNIAINGHFNYRNPFKRFDN